MTRFARRGKDNPKREEATKWNEMFHQNKGGNHSDSSYKRRMYDDRINKRNNKFNKFDNEKLVDLVDKNVKADLDKLKQEKKITDEEYSEMIKKEVRTNQRRNNRIQERDDSKVCFKCRKSGHNVANCPEIKKDNDQGTGICYKCGSTEHSVIQCKVKVAAGAYPFAKCFICNETGHLSKQCPDNPRGLYPNGGSCKNCGSVEHYRKDCPKLIEEEPRDAAKTLPIFKPSDNIEEIEDEVISTVKKPVKSVNNKKVVKF